MKKCSKCKEEKPSTKEFFSAKAGTKDGLRTYCKPCGSLYTKQWHGSNPGALDAWRKANADKIKESRREYRKKNADKIAEYGEQWLLDNPDYHKNWSDENRQSRRDACNRHHTKKRATDPAFKLYQNMSSLVRHHLRGGKNGAPWESMVGYTALELKTHLEAQFHSGMSWENQGKWHIDHIVAATAFSIQAAGDDEFMACWALSNLRPL